MKNILLCCALVSALMNNSALAVDIIPSNSNYYYQLGGGSDISMPPASDQQNITIGGDSNTNLGFTCDGFNPAISIAHTVGNIKGSMQGLEQNVIDSATGAVAAMPMYLLSKSNKDLYNLLENTMTGAQETFHLSMNSCQDALNKINNNKSPYQNWFSISDSQGWMNDAKRAKQGQNVDINATRKQVTKNPEQYGIPWVHKGQNSGGTTGNQVAIKVIYDVVVAGYNSMVDPSYPLDAKTTQADKNSGLARYWKTADDAGNWARLVLGDITISSDPKENDTSRGIGLMTMVQTCPELASNQLTCAKTLAQNLEQIVDGDVSPSADELRSVSSNEMMITPEIIEGIRNKDKEDQVLAVSKLSQDVALQNTVDQALMLRRVLIAGSQTNPVHNLKPALTTVNHAISQLNNDIQNILFQFRVRKELMTNTAETIMSNQQQSEANAVSENTQTQKPQMVNGAIYKGN